ncbi:GreA/GreB family elongation factor [Parvibaculum sp.]|jgi:regulator of nucleoside diphosphate kinase|uniref:GreA/GreB family elongation factor n=1 Tax=Parvibaculum sp. TaxID=2024848 RepID=UPI0039190B83
MSMRDTGAMRLQPNSETLVAETRPVLGLHDYGRLETAVFDHLDILSPMRPQVAALLAAARVVPSREVPGDTVTLGSIVRYRVDGDTLQRRILVLGREHAPNGQYVNVLTPVGLALIGRRSGETVTAAQLDGGKLTIFIEGIDHQPEAELRARSGSDNDHGPEAA